MAAHESYNVVLVGAGEINFGSPEGPWNHTARLEAILSSRLQVLALIDPDVARSQARIDEKTSTSSPSARSWSVCRPLATVSEAATALKGRPIDLIVVGCPPHFRGTTQQGKDTDVQILATFPHAKAVMVEKPVAAVDPSGGECERAMRIMQDWSRGGGIVGVGYMLRYSKAVKAIRDILSTHNLTPTCINARYFMAYEFARKLSWWNKTASCGPVVEQATHFVDLIRFIAGPSDNHALLATVRATAVEHDEEAGALSKLGFDEEQIAPADRVPRVTTAFWKHRKGTIGSLCHGITLHGTTYDTELEVLADGWVMRLRDAYAASPSLSIRRPGAANEETIVFEDDDPFFSQLSTFVEASSSSEAPRPLSSFEDALRTYELTWQIRRASEQE